MSTDSYRILRCEQSLFQLRFMHDEAYLRSILSEDYMEIGKSGRIFGLDDELKGLLHTESNRDIDMYNYTCDALGENIFLVHYITVNRNTQIMRTSIWGKKENRFQLRFHQATALAEPVILHQEKNLFSPIILVSLTEQYRDAFYEMMKEWREENRKQGTNHSPSTIFRYDETDFDAYVSKLERTTYEGGFVPNRVFFCYHTALHKMIGAVDIRLDLNDGLLQSGGHIGDGIRPSFRHQGYGTQMVSLALEKCRELGLKRALICCDHNNIASRNTIVRNGGILENMVIDEDGNLTERYWIEL